MSTSSGKRHDIRLFSRTDHELAELAARQHNRVASWQLRRIGFSKRRIQHRRSVGRLIDDVHGVYAVGALVDTPDARRMTAVLAAGEDAALAARSGMSLHGIGSGWSKGHELIAPREIDRPGLRVIQSVIPADEITEVRGIPVTTVNRAILDSAAVLETKRQVSRLINEALRLQLYDKLSLPDLIERHPRHRGRKLVEAALAAHDTAITLYDFEEEGLLFVRSLGLPEPRVNEWVLIRGVWRKPDLSWSGPRVAVEFDSKGFHDSTHEDWESDRARDAAYAAGGWVLFPITWRRLREDRAILAAELRSLFAERAAA